jgi:hypothetical protein
MLIWDYKPPLFQVLYGPAHYRGEYGTPFGIYLPDADLLCCPGGGCLDKSHIPD